MWPQALIFGGNIFILSVFFREKHKILPYLWINIKKYLEENLESEVTDILGNGYCFLGSVVEVLRTNYSDVVTQEQLTQQVMKFLCLNYEKYTMYHTQGEKDMEPTIADTLLSDIIDFFTNKNYNQNTVDVLMKIVADVLNIDLNIYQNNRGQIQVLNFAGDNSTHTVNVKFTHNNSNTVMNHYDAITLISKSNRTKENTEGRSVPTFKKPFIKTEIGQTNKSSCEQFIDLTDDDMDNPKVHGSSTDYNRTSSNDSWSDETYISSDGTSEKSTQPNSEPGNSSGYPYNDTEDVTTETSGTDNPEMYNIEDLSTTTFSTIEQQALAQGVSHRRPFPT